MRLSLSITCFSAWTVFAAGCSSSNNSPNNSTTDASMEGSTSSGNDAMSDGPTATSDAPACTPDASLLDYQPSSEPLGGGATVAGCFDCVKTMCSSSFGTCNASCACNSAVNELYTCLGAGTAPGTCLSPLVAGAGADKPLSGLTVCTETMCGDQCPLTGSGAASDGGTPDAAGDSGPSDGAPPADGATSDGAASSDGATSDGAASDSGSD